MKFEEIYFYMIDWYLDSTPKVSNLESYDMRINTTEWGYGEDFKNSISKIFETSKLKFIKEIDNLISNNMYIKQKNKENDFYNEISLSINTFEIEGNLFKRYIESKDKEREKLEKEIVKMISDFIYKEKTDRRLRFVKEDLKIFKYKHTGEEKMI